MSRFSTSTKITITFIVVWMLALIGFIVAESNLRPAKAEGLPDIAIAMPMAAFPVEMPEMVVSDTTMETTVVNNTVQEKPVEDNVALEFTYYTIQSGDSLWSICSDYYSDGSYYAQLASYNDMSIHDTIHPGEQIKIPLNVASVEVKEQETAKNNPTGDVDTSGMKFVGNYRITGYDPYCAHCCGKVTGIGSSGRKIEVGYSVGCNDLPSGTKLYIEGYGYYRVDDTGAGGGGYIDIACSSHEECYKMTNQNIPVYIVEG